MLRYISLILFLFAGCPSPAPAVGRTANFVVTISSAPQVEQEVADWAEYYRKEKALHWLGQEIPNWSKPCPIEVKTTANAHGSGNTGFAFFDGKVLDQRMHVEGRYDRIIRSVLPHEITHTIFAHHFGRPLPRWADEGGAVLSEDEIETKMHCHLAVEVMDTGRHVPLRRVMKMSEYPEGDCAALYSEGFSLTSYLVKIGGDKVEGRQKFIKFLDRSLQSKKWDVGLKEVYGISSVEVMEPYWVSYCRGVDQYYRRQDVAKQQAQLQQYQGVSYNPNPSGWCGTPQPPQQQRPPAGYFQQTPKGLRPTQAQGMIPYQGANYVLPRPQAYYPQAGVPQGSGIPCKT